MDKAYRYLRLNTHVIEFNVNVVDVPKTLSKIISSGTNELKFLTAKEAEEIIRINEEEVKQQAVESLSKVLEGWVHGGDADCIIAEFEELLNKDDNGTEK